MLESTEDSDIVDAVVSEGIEALESVMGELARLEADPTDLAPLDALFRCFHSVKGNASMVDMHELSEFAHRVEDILSELLTVQTAVSRAQLQLIQQGVDLAVGLLDGSQIDVDGDDYADARATFLVRFSDHCASSGGEGRTPPEGECPGDDGSPNGEKERAANVMPNSVANPVASRGRSPGVERESVASSTISENESFRVKSKNIRGLVALAGDLFHLTARLDRITQQYNALDNAGIGSELREISGAFDSATNELYEQMLDIQKVAVSQLTRPLDRIVRDVCRVQDKWIAFVVEGKDLRIDRRVLDRVRDSLVHMVRNSVDHGVETADVRRKVGKPEKATVCLRIEENDDFVTFTLVDDGKGIDTEAVLAKAVRLGLVASGAAAGLCRSRVLDFIFDEGFSTVNKVTDLSGRGVGMNVVARAVREAGGSIETSSEEGKGTKFVLNIPKAGSPVVEGLVVRVGQVVFLVPMKGIFKFGDWSAVRVINGLDQPDMVAVADGVYPLAHLRAGECDGQECARVALLIEDPRSRRCVVPVAEVLGHTRALVARVEADADLLGGEHHTFVRGDGGIGYVVDVEAFVDAAYRGP
ncbi:MAG: ATP-binding protein [Nannocystaceae bacterium]